jgi:hypothetical protein
LTAGGSYVNDLQNCCLVLVGSAISQVAYRIGGQGTERAATQLPWWNPNLHKGAFQISTARDDR